MTHEDEGHYSAKHPSEATIDQATADAVKQRAEGGAGRAAQGRTGSGTEAGAGERTITCAAAHEIAAELGITPAEVGTTVDLLEYRLIECQLRLFGTSDELQVPDSPDELPQELRDRLARATSQGRIACVDCWSIADDLGEPRPAASAACNALGIKVKPCQLGAF